MDIIYGKNQMQDNMIDQIVELFASSYGKYHYERFQSHEGIVALLADIQFDCLLIVDGHRVCGFAGFYIKSEQQDTVVEVVLAHLLVDPSVRGKGYGTLIEEARQKMIDRLKGDKVIYASCVEKPYNSIQMKLDRDYCVGGFRYSYRPGKNMRENAVVMMCSKDVIRDVYVEKPRAITQKILKKGNPNISFKPRGVDAHYEIEVTKDEILGRTICNVLDICEKGKKLDSFFLNQLRLSTDYVGVYLSPDIDGFSHIDKILVENYFYPLCYVPFINGGAGMLEYQYLKNGITDVLQDDTISLVAKEFLNSLV